MLKLLATPAFLVLAVINHRQPSPLCTVAGDLGFLSSMWFMYVVMAAAHGGAWLQLGRDRVEALLHASPRRAPDGDPAAP